MTDAAIPLQVQTPQVASPLATMGGLMQLRAHMGQIALQQAQIAREGQQTENLKAEAQQRNRDLADQNTIQEALKDPATAKAFGSGDFSFLNGKIQPKTLDLVRSNHITQAEKMATTESSVLAANEAKHKLIERGLSGLKELGDDQKAVEAYPGLISNLVEQGALNHGTFPDTIQSAADIDHIAAVNGAYQGLNTRAQALKKEQAETAEKTASSAEKSATTAKLKAETPGATAESEKKQLVTQAMRDALADPSKGVAAIDAALPASVDAAANAGYKAAWQSAMSAGSPEAAARIVEAAAQHATSLSSATRAAHVQTAVDTARAEMPIHVATEVQKQLAIAKLSPDSFASITNPQARAAAMSNYEKDSKDYAGKIADAKRIQDFVAAAQSGNKAAPGLIPLTELRGLVNRVNRNELEAVGSGAGSLLDKISGKLGSITEGQPIPADILADTAKIADVMAGAARRDYELKVQVNNKTYGGNVKPIDFAPASIPSAQPASHKYNVGDAVMYQGKPHKVVGYDKDGKLLIDPK